MATVEQIKQEIIDWYNSQDHINHEDEYDEYAPVEYFDGAWEGEYGFYEAIYSYDLKNPTVVQLPSGPVKIVKDKGGMDEGSSRVVVFSVGEQFFRVEGYYSSWNGDNWDDAQLEEVFQKEVTVIKYTTKKED